MSIGTHLDKLETVIAGGRVPGTSRTLVSIDTIGQVLKDIRAGLPDHINEAEAVLRQKEAIIKQAELEARRIRTYADEEATTIRQLAEEQSTASLDSAREQARNMVKDTEVVRKGQMESAAVLQEAEEKSARIIADAEQQVNGIISAAANEAEERRRGADNYAREVLFTLEERIADTLGQVRSGIDTLDSRNASHAASSPSVN